MSWVVYWYYTFFHVAELEPVLDLTQHVRIMVRSNDKPNLILQKQQTHLFLSQGPSAIEQGSEDQLSKVKKFWQSLSTGQRSEILSISLDDIWAKVPELSDDGGFA